MRRIARFIALYAICLGTPALALAQEDTQAAVAQQHEGAEAGPAHEEHDKGIENWWSFDYKAKHLPPPSRRDSRQSCYSCHDLSAAFSCGSVSILDNRRMESPAARATVS